MGRRRLTALCTTVVIGALLLAAASASASLPEYRYCVKAQPPKTGEFADSGCTTHSATPHTGTWEAGSWSQAKNKTLKGAFGGLRIELYEPNHKSEPWLGGPDLGWIRCKKGKLIGEVTGAKTSSETIALTGCDYLGAKCTTSGAKRGEILTVPLSGEIGYLSGGRVGSLLKPAAGETISEFECVGEQVLAEFWLSGSTIAVDSGNLNAFAKQGTRTWALAAESEAPHAQEVVFGEFPSGGPFYMTVEATSPEVTRVVVGASLEAAVAMKFGAVLKIEA